MQSAFIYSYEGKQRFSLNTPPICRDSASHRVVRATRLTTAGEMRADKSFLCFFRLTFSWYVARCGRWVDQASHEIKYPKGQDVKDGPATIISSSGISVVSWLNDDILLSFVTPSSNHTVDDGLNPKLSTAHESRNASENGLLTGLALQVADPI